MTEIQIIKILFTLSTFLILPMMGYHLGNETNPKKWATFLTVSTIIVWCLIQSYFVVSSIKVNLLDNKSIIICSFGFAFVGSLSLFLIPLAYWWSKRKELRKIE